MEMKYIPEAAWGIYQLVPGDMSHVFRRSGLLGNKLSPFRYHAAQSAVSKPSAWFIELSENPDFDSVARLLLEPDLKILFHHGGMTEKKEQFYTFLHTEDPHVLALFFENRDVYQLLHFSDWESYLQWWAGIYSADSSSEYELVFRDKDEIETLVCALHCIDYYRRVCMESMLDFQKDVDISLHTHDFVQLLKTSLASADTRWLLPSLFEFTPGLKNLCLALKPEHLRSIAELKFVSCNQDLIMTMGERSRKMGTEFLASRMEAIGWQATALIKDEERALSHVFLAPTAVANHLFSFEKGANKENRFRHQALTRFDLINTLVNWIDAIRELADKNKAAAAVEIPERPQVLLPQEEIPQAATAQTEPQEISEPDSAVPAPEEPDPATGEEQIADQLEPEPTAESIPEPAEVPEPEPEPEWEPEPEPELEPEPVLQQQMKLWPQKNPDEEDVEPLTLLYHEPEPEPKKKKCRKGPILLILLLTVILGGSVFYWWTQHKNHTSMVMPQHATHIIAAYLTTDIAGQRPVLY